MKFLLDYKIWKDIGLHVEYLKTLKFIKDRETAREFKALDNRPLRKFATKFSVYGQLRKY